MNPDSENMEPMEWAKFVLRNRNEKGYARAYNIFMTNAREGDPDAEYSLGMMYLDVHMYAILEILNTFVHQNIGKCGICL